MICNQDNYPGAGVFEKFFEKGFYLHCKLLIFNNSVFAE